MAKQVEELLFLPGDLELKQSPVSGRGLYAKEAIPRGSVLLSSHQPLAHVARREIRHLVCQKCFKTTEENLLKCGDCKLMYYCNKKCQKGDWKFHKSECAGIKRIRESMPTATPSDTMLLVARLVTMVRRSESKKQQLDYLSADCNSEQMKKDLPYLVLGVASLLGDTSEDAQSLITSIVARVDGNAFNVFDSTYEEIVGVALYWVPSLVNHSCEPNSLITFDGKDLTLRAVVPLKPGDQVLISYCELMESLSRRQAHLQSCYTFHCTCPRCQTEESEASPWSKMYAPLNGGVREEVRLGAMKKGFALVDEGQEKKSDWSGIVQQCRGYLSECGDLLHPLNVALTSVRQELMRAEFNLQEWEAALETGKLLTPAYREFLPEWHPVRIVHLVKMGKLRRLLPTEENLRASVQELEEARAAIPLGFGEGSSLEREVVSMLVDSKRELQGWSR